MKRSAAAEKPTKKKVKTSSGTLDTFFASPKAKVAFTSKAADVIEIDDSDDDAPPVAGPSKPRKPKEETGDAAFAARLAAEDDGQLRADEALARKLANEPSPAKTPARPVHPLFARRADPTPVVEDVKGKGKAVSPQSSPKVASTPFGSAARTSSAVPIATEYPLDMDILDFQPARDIDTSTWPHDSHGKMQVPYAFLTAAFVAIGGTTKRLLCVRAHSQLAELTSGQNAHLPRQYAANRHALPT